MTDEDYVIERFWFVMGPSGRTIDGAMPVIWFWYHDKAAEWAVRYPDCWLEPGFMKTPVSSFRWEER